MSTRERYESHAEQWNASGQPASALWGGYSLIALRCWSYSDGAKAEGFSETLQAFIRASEQAQNKNWLDAYFDDRESCRGCGESFRFENVSLCTACSRTYCYRCKGEGGLAANGNSACPCGNGELVG